MEIVPRKVDNSILPPPLLGRHFDDQDTEVSLVEDGGIEEQDRINQDGLHSHVLYMYMYVYNPVYTGPLIRIRNWIKRIPFSVNTLNPD